jgi:hypothetical protein
MEAVEATKDDAGKEIFQLRWACPAQGLAAFIISAKSQSEVSYTTVWNTAPSDAGQFRHVHKLEKTDLDRKWCFRVRAIDRSMQRSQWSATKCAVWETKPPEILGWPRVSEPGKDGDLTAFFLSEHPSDKQFGRPAIVLSDDLSSILNSMDAACPSNAPDCDGNQCIDTSDTLDPCEGLCALLKTRSKLSNFMVYRQEETLDFVQTSPLLEGFFCIADQVDDPFIFLRNFKSGAIKGIDSSKMSQVQGRRLFYLDRYPFRMGTKIRYQVLAVDGATGEVARVHSTNWVIIP